MSRTVTLPTSSTSSTVKGSASASMSHIPNELKRKGVNTVNQAFNIGAREELDAAIARMSYTVGLSFNLSKNSYYKKSYTYAASNLIVGYSSLRITLLQREKAHVERLLQPIRGTWKEKGISICSDG